MFQEFQYFDQLEIDNDELFHYVWAVDTIEKIKTPIDISRLNINPEQNGYIVIIHQKSGCPFKHRHIFENELSAIQYSDHIFSLSNKCDELNNPPFRSAKLHPLQIEVVEILDLLYKKYKVATTRAMTLVLNGYYPSLDEIIYTLKLYKENEAVKKFTDENKELIEDALMAINKTA